MPLHRLDAVELSKMSVKNRATGMAGNLAFKGELRAVLLLQVEPEPSRVKCEDLGFYSGISLKCV